MSESSATDAAQIPLQDILDEVNDELHKQKGLLEDHTHYYEWGDVPGTEGGDIGSGGYQGYQGYQGDQGHQGYQGAPGTGDSGTGTQGAQGFQGNQGTQGTQGRQGSTGATGPAGATGATGATGYGAPGPQGPQGASGSTAAVNQRANLGSTTAANSVTASLIGVTGVLSPVNGGTNRANNLISHGGAKTGNANYHLTHPETMMYMSFNLTQAPTANDQLPRYDLTDSINSQRLYNSYSAGTAFVFITVGTGGYTETRPSSWIGVANGGWPSVFSHYFIRFCSTLTIANQTDSGKVGRSWSFSAQYPSGVSEANATTRTRIISDSNTTSAIAGRHGALVFIGMHGLNASMTGGHVADSQRYFAIFGTLCGQ